MAVSVGSATKSPSPVQNLQTNSRSPQSSQYVMENEIPIVVFYTIVLAGLGIAWVVGYLDRHQSMAQNYAPCKMGKDKAFYGLRSASSI